MHLGSMQKVLLGAVMRQLLGRRLPGGSENICPLLLESAVQNLGALPADIDAERTPAVLFPKPPATSVVLRALGNFVFTFSTQRRLVEPLVSALLAKSLESSLVVAIYAAESDIGPLVRFLSPKTAGDVLNPSVPIPNPFREALLAALIDNVGLSTPNTPLAAWALRDVQVACPEVLPVMPHPKQLIEALRFRAQTPRVAQRVVLLALLDLLAPPSMQAARGEVATGAVNALAESGRVLRVAAISKQNATGLEDTLAVFLEEWDWHAKFVKRQDMTITCRGAELMLECAGNEPKLNGQPARNVAELMLEGATELEQIRHAARTLITLRHLCARLVAGGGSGGAAAPESREEACPLDMEVGGFTGAADVIQCRYPFGCSIMLHPTLLLVNEPNNGENYLFSERTPLWRVTAIADGSNPLVLTLRIKGQSTNEAPREAGFWFEDARSGARASKHLQESKERELKRLESQLVTFVDRVLQGCEQGRIVRTVVSTKRVEV